MKKKVLLMLSVVVLLVCIFAISVSAAETGCVGGIYYTFDGTEATVSGENQKSCQLETVVIPEKVMFNDTEYTVTAIATKAFGSQNTNGGNSKIKSVTIPSTVTSVGERAFAWCTNLTEAYCKSTKIGSYMFQDCTSLETVTLENTVEIVGNAFNRTKITSVVIPSTVTSVGSYAFKECKSLTKVVVLGSIMGSNMFYGCSALNTLVLTEKFETFGSAALGVAPAGAAFITYYTGTDYDRIKTLGSSTSRFKSAVAYSYSEYDPDKHTDLYKIIYNSNLCQVAFDGAHISELEPDCVNSVACSRCLVPYKEALGHEFDLEKGATVSNIIYENFGSDGHYEIKCARCTVLDTSKIANAIFTAEGYSVNPTRTGFATGFSINKASLEAYEDFYGKTISFGIVIFNPSYLGDDALFVDGKINSSRGAIQVSMKTTYSSCNLSINGFTDGIKDLELILAGYAYVGDDFSNIHVIQKEYISTEEKPVASPMHKKLTRGNHTLYTVCFESIIAPVVMPNKSELDEFLKA